jgi:hypothetical protein
MPLSAGPTLKCVARMSGSAYSITAVSPSGSRVIRISSRDATRRRRWRTGAYLPCTDRRVDLSRPAGAENPCPCATCLRTTFSPLRRQRAPTKQSAVLTKIPAGFSHPFSHPPGVTGWTSRSRLRMCFRLLGTARYGPTRPFSFSQAECRRFEPGIPLPKNLGSPRAAGRCASPGTPGSGPTGQPRRGRAVGALSRRSQLRQSSGLSCRTSRWATNGLRDLTFNLMAAQRAPSARTWAPDSRGRSRSRIRVASTG